MDAIVEDLRVRTVLLSPTTPTCALASPQAQFAKLNAVLICQPTGGDECPDRRVEKGLGYVRGLDIPDATIMELADRLARSVGGFDQFQSLSSRTKAFRPTADTTRMLAYTAPRLQGFSDILSLAARSPYADAFSDYGD